MTSIKDDNESLIATIDENDSTDRYAAAVAAVAVRELRGNPMDIKTVWRVLRSMGMPDLLDIAVVKRAKNVASEFTGDLSALDDIRLWGILKESAKKHLLHARQKGTGVQYVALVVVLVAILLLLFFYMNVK